MDLIFQLATYRIKSDILNFSKGGMHFSFGSSRYGRQSFLTTAVTQFQINPLTGVSQ
jgi:hypothetical protein